MLLVEPLRPFRRKGLPAGAWHLLPAVRNLDTQVLYLPPVVRNLDTGCSSDLEGKRNLDTQVLYLLPVVRNQDTQVLSSL
jgi:hypothetical protein